MPNGFLLVAIAMPTNVNPNMFSLKEGTPFLARPDEKRVRLGNIGDEEIIRLCYFFCKIDEDLISFRHLSKVNMTVAITCTGQKLEFSVPEGSEDKAVLLKITVYDVVKAMKSKLTSVGCSNRRKLLGYGLLWLLADSFGLPDIFEEMLHPEAEMFGFSGKESILESKQSLLKVMERGSPNYKVDSIHQIDYSNRAIVANFECLLPGKEGIGTDFLKFDGDWKAIKADSIRH